MELRKQAAKIVGFDNHSDFMLNQKMAKTTKKAQDFLEMLNSELDEIFVKEMKLLEETKAGLATEVSGNGDVASCW